MYCFLYEIVVMFYVYGIMFDGTLLFFWDWGFGDVRDII